MRCCQTCQYWDRESLAGEVVGGFRYCLIDFDRGVPTPKAPDDGQWCEWHVAQPDAAKPNGGDSASRDAA